MFAMYRLVSTLYSVLTLQIQDTHVHIMPENIAHIYQDAGLMTSCLLLLPWCMATTGYQISSDSSNSQQQLKAGYKQTM